MRKFGRSKYGVDQTAEGRARRTYQGRVYDSLDERRHAEQLDLDPDVVWWLRQPRFDLGEDDRYAADFLVVERNGTIYAVDVKGVETAGFRRTRKLWAKYADIPLRVVRKGVTIDTVLPPGV
ncbi:MAG TPA: DUF1064 domain-containing protein [Polyangiales bacterium]|nr:DUF1064 domain-containing protein [Polyangiales bacterium]